MASVVLNLQVFFSLLSDLPQVSIKLHLLCPQAHIFSLYTDSCYGEDSTLHHTDHVIRYLVEMFGNKKTAQSRVKKKKMSLQMNKSLVFLETIPFFPAYTCGQ